MGILNIFEHVGTMIEGLTEGDGEKFVGGLCKAGVETAWSVTMGAVGSEVRHVVGDDLQWFADNVEPDDFLSNWG